MTSTKRGSVVVDAAVVLKWQFDDEEHVAQSVALRDAFLVSSRVKLVAPTLIVHEIINGISTAVRRKRVSAKDALQALDNLLGVGIEIKEASPQRALNLGLQYGLSAYDAAYVAVAEAEGCELVTGDRMLYEAVKDRLGWVKWLGEYSLEG